MDDEPKPKRRPAWRHALGGLALLVVLGCNLWLLERAGLTDWSTLWRYVRTAFTDRRAAREKVFVGMYQEEVEKQIGRGGGPGYITQIWQSDLDRPPVPCPYSLPFKRAEYPEFGFDVIYHGRDVLHQDDWEVVAVVDR